MNENYNQARMDLLVSRIESVIKARYASARQFAHSLGFATPSPIYRLIAPSGQRRKSPHLKTLELLLPVLRHENGQQMTLPELLRWLSSDESGDTNIIVVDQVQAMLTQFKRLSREDQHYLLDRMHETISGG
ncbi:MAG: hypothetical protein DDT26_00219 [Dehalococcoidia bacterium]|nr:hypothetical protein [Chloroflexota bacterium]